MKRIALIGGGTGGHIYPLVAVYEHLKLNRAKCRYFGPKGPWAEAMERAGVPTSSIAGAKLRRYFSLGNFIDGPKFLWSIVQAMVKIAAFAPDAAFSKGGTGSLPVLLACKMWGVPIVIHESDSIPSATGRIAGRWAKIIELGWASAASAFPEKETHVVGVPLRADIRASISRNQKDAKRELGLDPAKRTILVIGGSQGSDRINKRVLEELPELLSKYQVVHQIGSTTYVDYMKRYEGVKQNIPESLRANYRPYEYMDKEMPLAYAAADCVVSRAGSAIFEIAAYRKPVILIPLPEAANGHQRKNAGQYPAAIVMQESDTEKNLSGAISSILDDPERKREVEEKAKAFAKPDAAERIAEDILRIAK